MAAEESESQGGEAEKKAVPWYRKHIKIADHQVNEIINGK